MNFGYSLCGAEIADPVFVLVRTHDFEYAEVLNALDELDGGLLFPRGSTSSVDMVVNGAAWLLFTEADLVIFTLMHGTRIRARYSLGEIRAAVEMIKAKAPNESVKDFLTSLASGGYKISTWPSYVDRWARQNKIMRDRRSVPGKLTGS